jgi:hypothetical protein
MKLTINTYKRLLWITASASLLGIAGCSNLPGTASSRASSAWAAADTAKYTTSGVLNDEDYHRSLDPVIGLSPTAYDALYNPNPLPRGAGNGP